MSEPFRVRALVLAAGLGERLRPLTSMVPKPLLPAGGQAVAAHSLEQLSKAGCEAVALNLHHRAPAIRQAFGESWNDLPLHYSHEEELLGTLGALAPLREFFADCDAAIVLNGDSLCRWPLPRLLRRHWAAVKSGALATVLVSSRAKPERYGGGIAVDGDGWVAQFRKTGPIRPGAGAVKNRLVFAGAHVLSRELLDGISSDARPADIVGELYQPRLATGGRFAAVSTGRDWHDLGTPDRYLDGVLDWARGRTPTRWLRDNWVSASASIGPRVQLRRVAIEAGVTVGAKAKLDQVLLLPGAEVGEGAELQRVIVGPGVEIPAGSNVEQRMVTPLVAGRAVNVADSVLGQLVFTPIAER